MSNPRGSDGHEHPPGESWHPGWKGHGLYPVHTHTADGRAHWETDKVSPELEAESWKNTAKIAVDEMERHARSIIDTANLIRAQLELGTVLQLRHVKRAPFQDKRY